MLLPTEKNGSSELDNNPTEYEIYAYIGERLKFLRKREGLSQLEVAKLIDLSKQQYQKYEAGTSKCSIHKLLRLCKFYYVVPETIIPFELSVTDTLTSNAFEANPDSVTNPSPKELSKLVAGFAEIKHSHKRKLVLELIHAMAS